jgi:stage II sporulation protein D
VASVFQRTFLTLFLFVGLGHTAQAFDNPPIRVRLQSSVDSIELEGIGVQIRGRESAFEKVAIPRNQSIRIERVPTGWKVTRSQTSEIIETPFLALKAIGLRQAGKLLPNQVFLAPQKQKKFDVIGILPLESYLVGVIASEMPLSWPIESLKAQAVAARSYALVTMHERAKSYFHVESTILDQVFSHIGAEPDESPLIAKAKLAVKDTEGIVLLTPKGNTLKAFYHSDCGGKTSDAKNIWGYGVSTGVAVDASCPGIGKHNWNFEISEAMLSQKLNQYLKKESGILRSFSLIRPGPEERVEKMELHWASGEKTKISAHEFRAALGYDRLRSTLFEAKKAGDRFQFIGRGFGHGVGLCQWGSRALGKMGKNYKEILEHYYPKADLQNLDSQRLASIKNEPELATQIK